MHQQDVRRWVEGLSLAEEIIHEERCAWLQTLDEAGAFQVYCGLVASRFVWPNPEQPSPLLLTMRRAVDLLYGGRGRDRDRV